MAYEEDELTTFTKVRGLLIDECQDTFVQYADFLATISPVRCCWI